MWHWQDPSPCLLPSPLQWPFPLQGRSAPPWHAVGTRARSQHTRQAARAQPSLSAHHPTALWLSLTRTPLHAKASRLWGQRPASRVRASGQPQLKHGARVLTHGVWDCTGQRGHAPVAPGRWDISKGRQEAAVAREGSEPAGLPLRPAGSAHGRGATTLATEEPGSPGPWRHQAPPDGRACAAPSRAAPGASEGASTALGGQGRVAGWEGPAGRQPGLSGAPNWKHSWGQLLSCGA